MLSLINSLEGADQEDVTNLADHLATFSIFEDLIAQAKKQRPIVLQKVVTNCIEKLLTKRESEPQETRTPPTPEISMKYETPSPRTSTTFSIEALDMKVQRIKETLTDESLASIIAKTGETIEAARNRIVDQAQKFYSKEQ